MKTVFGQKWKKCRVGNEFDEGFRYCSNYVLGKGDETLKPSHSPMLGPINWLRKHLFWKKYIILMPASDDPTAKFRVGFYSRKYNLCMVSSVAGSVSDGPFVMRLGPDDCEFFVIATKKVTLKMVGYIRKEIKISSKNEWKCVAFGDDWIREHWSNLVPGTGDELSASENSLPRKHIVLLPQSKTNARIRFGFCKKGEQQCIISTTSRLVNDGPFAIPMKSGDYDFFVASDDDKVELHFGGYFYGDMKLF